MHSVFTSHEHAPTEDASKHPFCVRAHVGRQKKHRLHLKANDDAKHCSGGGTPQSPSAWAKAAAVVVGMGEGKPRHGRGRLGDGRRIRSLLDGSTGCAGKGAGEGHRLSRWRGEGAAGWDRAAAATLIQIGDGGNQGTELRHSRMGWRWGGLREIKEEATTAVFRIWERT